MSVDILFSDYTLNSVLTLKNRIVMAPMTRVQASDDFVPTPAMADYYARRAAVGLMVTEGTVISPEARGHNNVPGIYNARQIAAWQYVTDKVHQQNGLIFSQLWHVGRVSHPHFLQGNLPVSASETLMTAKINRMEGLHYGKSRAATRAEIKNIVQAYAEAAKNALQAGFDGIEIHGANGYLIDQFLHYHTNQRADEYGGSVENRARFALEIVRACGAAIGYERVGIRLSPGAYLNEIIGEERDAAVFQYLLQQLNSYPLAYVHTGNFSDAQIFKELGAMTMTAFIRKHYRGTVIACGGYTIDRARQGLQQQEFDLVAIGRPLIANSDWVARVRENRELKGYDVSTLAILS